MAGKGKVLFDDLIGDWNIQSLNRNEVHIWFADLYVDDETLTFCRSLLSEDEKIQAESYLEKDLQRRYITSHGILRKLLSGYTGMNPNKIIFSKHTLGKPVLNKGGIHFNLSHSADKCGIAFSLDHEIGLDIEKIREMYDLEEMISRNFTVAEQSYIDKGTKGFLKRFFQYWTIKESYLKATGIGMRLDPRLIEFEIAGDTITLCKVNGQEANDSWKFRMLRISEEYTATIAYHPKQELSDPVELNIR